MRRIVFILSILLTAIGLSAQQTVTVQAQSYQVSDNLDLEAVAITFGESKNVEDFERRLNDPDNRISNLDLNNDGYVDFLRAVEVEEKGTHLIVIQAVIGQDLYQDVASVIVEGKNKNTATVAIVGNQNIYGSNYVIVPRYTILPTIFDWFWLPTYAVYHSVWYWDYYPTYYHRHVCLGYHSYHRHIHTWHTRHNNHCEFFRPTHHEPKPQHVEMYRGVVRNDYVTHRPNQGYRAQPTPNSHVEARPAITQARPVTQPAVTSTNRGRQPGSVSTSNNRVERPSTPTATRAITTNRTVTSTTPRSTASSTTTARPATSTSRKTTTTVRPSTSTSRNTSTTKTTSTAVRNTTTKTASTSTVKPRTTTSTSRSTSTSVQPSTSTSRKISTSSNTTSSTIKTNKNISTSRR